MLTVTGVTAAQRPQVEQVIATILGAAALELDLRVTRLPGGVWRVEVQPPPPDGMPSLLPAPARDGAYADLAEVLSLALTRALN